MVIGNVWEKQQPYQNQKTTKGWSIHKLYKDVNTCALKQKFSSKTVVKIIIKYDFFYSLTFVDHLFIIYIKYMNLNEH